jgi:DNA modification methylase
VRIIEGDCIDVMRQMDEASIDAIVTDPPYGLEFMGKEWDRLWTEHPEGQRGRIDGQGGMDTFGRSPNYVGGTRAQRWHQAWASEALRVLKPGGHLLAFGGTRTYHRLACAIEDVGFEIRDSVIWLYGSGFPKSLDVSKAIDRRRKDNPDWKRVGRWLCAQRGRMSAKELCGVIGAHGEVNHGGAVSNWENGFSCPTLEQWVALKDALGFGDEMDAEVWRLNGRKGKPGDDWEKREILGEVTGAQAESTGRYGGWGNDEDGDGISTYDVTAPATPEAAQWEGWGTALKPGHEPIVVARKPLSGTVAQNVLEHGTGALNIDGCRIGSDEITAHGGGVNRDGRKYGNGQGIPAIEPGSNPHTGRWPANVVLSHLPECERVGTRKVKGTNPREGGDLSNRDTALEGGDRIRTDHSGFPSETVPAYDCAPSCPVAELDRQSGEGRARGNITPTKSGIGMFHGEAAEQGIDPGDTGGASRFFANFDHQEEEDFVSADLRVEQLGSDWQPRRRQNRFRYVAKASRGERNAGLEGFEEKGALDDVRMNSGGSTPQQTPNQHRPQRNAHPTVKPIDLMRWLVRLVTPPGGTILDPFVGSGTTGIAAALEGFDFIGMERESEYVEIAKARIAFWESHVGRETDDVLREAGSSERLRREHEERGQLRIE